MIKSALILGIFAIGIGTAFAQWNPPTGPAPAGNVDAPVHTGLTTQIKKGNFFSDKVVGAFAGLFNYFGAGTFTGGNGDPNNPNASVKKGLEVNFASNVAVKGGPLFVNLVGATGANKDEAMNIKSNGTGLNSGAYFTLDNGPFNFRNGDGKRAFLGAGSIGLTGDKSSISIQSASTTNNDFPVDINMFGGQGQNFMNVAVEGGKVPTIVTNQPMLQAWNSTSAKRASLYADQVQLSGGNPGANKVLTSSNGNGDATWRDPNELVNSQTTSFILIMNGNNESLQGGEFKNNGDNAEIKCPVSHPIMISVGGECRGQDASRGQIKSLFVSWLGSSGNDRGNGQIFCERDGQGGVVSGMRAVCANISSTLASNVKPDMMGGQGGGIPPSQPPLKPKVKSWVNALDHANLDNWSAGNKNETCSAWINRLSVPDSTGKTRVDFKNVHDNTVITNDKCAYAKTNVKSKALDKSLKEDECLIGNVGTNPEAGFYPVSSCNATWLDSQGKYFGETKTTTQVEVER